MNTHKTTNKTERERERKVIMVDYDKKKYDKYLSDTIASTCADDDDDDEILIYVELKLNYQSSILYYIFW